MKTKRLIMKGTVFFKMLSEIEKEISSQSCGCMGRNYTPQRAKREWLSKDKIEAHYLKTVISRYIEVRTVERPDQIPVSQYVTC